MKIQELPELNKWKGKYLRYTFKSFETEFLKEKLNKFARLVDMYNSKNDKDGFKLSWSMRETGYLVFGNKKRIENTLDVIIEPYEQHKRKENINQQKRDL